MLFDFVQLKETDLPLLFQWLALPHVSKWWRESKDYDVFYKKYSAYISDHDIGCYLAYDREIKKPIGYISWYDAATCPFRKEQFPPETYGIDLFIADLNYLGRGYGPALIQSFIENVLVPLKPIKIIIDPEISNLKAIHVYQKVGFKKLGIANGTDGTSRVMVQLMELNFNLKSR